MNSLLSNGKSHVEKESYGAGVGNLWVYSRFNLYTIVINNVITLVNRELKEEGSGEAWLDYPGKRRLRICALYKQFGS